MALVRPTPQDPVQQTIEVGWPRELQFYERRYALLRALDQASVTKNWSVEQDEITVFFKDGQEMDVSSTRLELSVHRQAGGDALLGLLETVLKTIEPRGMTGLHTWFQHVLPVKGDYDELRKSSGARFFHDAWPREISDWALLVDGPAPKIGAIYQCEYGIVSKNEIPARLARRAGRIHGPATDRPAPKTTDVPELAVFADSNWGPAGPRAGPTLHAVVAGFLSDTFAEAQDLAASILAKFEPVL